MAKHSFGEIHLDVETGRDRAPARPEPDTPFRIAILGDFSGRASRGVCETGAKLASRRAILIDRDNFDDVLGQLGVQLRLPLAGGGELALEFNDIDDFRPEALYQRLDLFRQLKETRARLADSRTFAAAAAELGAAARPAATEGPSASHPQTAEPSANSSGAGLLDQIVSGGSGQKPARAVRRPDELRQYVEQITAPHLVPGPDPRQPELLAQVDRATGDAMRKILHHSQFQALEAAWRVVFLMIRKVETDVNLKLCLLDISRDELAADLASHEDLRQTGIYKLLVEKTVETAGAEAWSVLAGNYSFGSSQEDAVLLARMATIARAAGAPFVAGADTRVLGFGSFGEMPEARKWSGPAEPQVWQALRALPQSASVGLAMPRFLLRLPYGRKTDPTEPFDFEEMQSPPAHEDYLWGNPGLACAMLLAQSFSESGWEMRPGSHQEIDGLPLHVFQRDGEPVAKPCAEALLTEPAVEKILELGVMPLVSPVGRDAVRVVRFQSLADPPTALAGPWESR